MGNLRQLSLAALRQPLQRVLTDGLQHTTARLTVVHRRALDQALVQQSVHPIQNADCERSDGDRDLLGGLQCPAASEDREPPQQELLTHVEQGIAPVDRGAQGALAFR